jgi:excinuclease ABC subunit A
MRAEEYAHFENLALQEFYEDIWVRTIQWAEQIKNTIYVDQSSIWKTPRSCPATFVNVFDKIRMLYAGTTESKYLWFNASHFSFNSDKWACPACNWYGYKKIELQFLPDTYVPCELCHWSRYKPEILSITWRWKTISEVLDMYIYEALDFFHELDHIKEELELMVEIWLWYLKMWQPAHTLSWWESQRLKLVKHLLKEYKGNTVYFLDEPTVWLHPEDIQRLLKVLKRFLDKWDTILMIEHDQDILQFADHVIRLDNGRIVNK